MCELQGPLRLLPDPGILVLEDGTCPSSTSAPGDVAEGSGRRTVLRELIPSPRKVQVWEWCRRSEELNGVSLEVCLIAVYMAPWGFFY